MLIRVFLVPSYKGGDGNTYRRGYLTETLDDGTLVVQPVTEFRRGQSYFTTIDCRPEDVRFENPLPLREYDGSCDSICFDGIRFKTTRLYS